MADPLNAPPRWRWLAYAALMVWAGTRWSSGFAPPALGQDDLWVAFLVKFATAGDLLTYQAPVPMGFIAAEQLVAPWFSGELSLQIVPFVCGLAILPLAGWATSRLTGRWELGLLAATLVCLVPDLGPFSVRVKQFTWDAAALLVLLAIGARHLDPEEPARPGALALAAGIALLFSFNTIFLGFVLCHIRIVMSLSDRRALGRAVVAALAYDVFAWLLFTYRLDAQSADWVVRYWQKQYAFPQFVPSWEEGLPTGWLQGAGGRAYFTWLPKVWEHWTLLAPAGLLTLFLTRRTRWQGLALLAFLVALPVAGLLMLYPFGGGRPDFFFKPTLAVLAAVGIGAFARALAAGVQRIGAVEHRAKLVATLVPLLVIAAIVARAPRRPITYGSGRMTTAVRDLVAWVDSIARPDDLILLTVRSRWNVGYYTTLPLKVGFTEPTQKLFDFETVSPRSQVAANLARQLQAEGAPDRVLFVGIFEGKALPIYERQFRRAGFDVEKVRDLPKAKSAAYEFVRRRPPIQP